ncbi:helix-turn-helix transcriptional regulator [Demequina sp. NBRC 110052]|uniref:ArsR/SmtB family transcription factor n=1 Tax=Demequina sp. NBRC 110052 TaxID=1570341 RepID=UPI0009FD4030|nr:metalloregulator ArsR/SmtB family transcription factor [Demequina sp. NBRC 110052]
MNTGRPLNEVKADLFKGLAHPLRIRVLELLAERELTVAELIDATGLEPSHLSQHLRVLRGYGLVVSERNARHVTYRLAHPSVAGLLAAARALLRDVLASHEELARRQGGPIPEGAL